MNGFHWYRAAPATADGGPLSRGEQEVQARLGDEFRIHTDAGPLPEDAVPVAELADTTEAVPGARALLARSGVAVLDDWQLPRLAAAVAGEPAALLRRLYGSRGALWAGRLAAAAPGPGDPAPWRPPCCELWVQASRVTVVRTETARRRVLASCPQAAVWVVPRAVRPLPAPDPPPIPSVAPVPRLAVLAAEVPADIAAAVTAAGWTWRAAAADTASAPGDAALLCLDRPSSFPSASWLRAVSWGLPGICAADCSWGPAGAALVVPAALGTVDPLALPPLLHALAADPSRGREVAARGRAHLEALHAPATVAAAWRAPLRAAASLPSARTPDRDTGIHRPLDDRVLEAGAAALVAVGAMDDADVQASFLERLRELGLR